MSTYKPPLRKRLLADPTTRRRITFLASLLVRGIHMLSRRTTHAAESARPYMRGEQAAIYCFWHGRMLFVPLLSPPHRTMHALVSQHGDGGVIADMMHWLNVTAVRGSSSRGAQAAVRELIEVAANGHNIGITPDGPRGPHQVAAAGAVWLAAKSGLPIIPVSGTSSKRTHMKSWDAFTVPLPFGHIICEAGEPMHIHADSNDVMVEAYRIELERRLRALTAKLDAEAAGKESA